MSRKHISQSIHVLTLVLVVVALAVAGGAATSLGSGSGVRAAAITPPTQADVNAAVTRGVGFLDTQQNADGSFGSSFYVTAETEFALISYGVFDGGDFGALSAARQTIVKNAVTWLLGQQDKSGTSTDGNWGLNECAATYETGLGVSALSFNTAADPGVPAAITAGRQALLTLFQGDSGPGMPCSSADNSPEAGWCGGFNYDYDRGRSDESNTGFGLTGLALSGGVPPAIAALDIGWQHHIQEISTNPFATRNDGGGDYEPGCCGGSFSSNANDTGSLLFGLGFDKVPASDANVQAALKFGTDVLDVYELTKSSRSMAYHTGMNEDGSCDPAVSGCDWALDAGEGGYHYSLWALSKGFSEFVNPDLTDATNWYAKVADLLVTQQDKSGTATDGSWPVDGRDDATPIIATGFAIFALNLAGSPPPPPPSISGLSVKSGGVCTTVRLSWTNPTSPNYAGLRIRRRTDQFPTGPTDGTLVANVDKPGTTFDDTGLTPNATYFYSAFSYDPTGTLFSTPVTISVKTDCIITGPTLTVATAGTGSGSVASNPAGIACPSTCSAGFTSGAMVTLTPSPTAGSTFIGWSGACTGSGACIVTMDADKSVTATFTKTGPPPTGEVEIEGDGHYGVDHPVKFEIDDVQRTSTGVLEGDFEFSSKSRHLKFESTAILSLDRLHNVASFTASGELNGHGGYKVSVTGVDMRHRHGTPPSRISIELKNASGVVVFSSNGLRHIHDGDITIENKADVHGANGAMVEPATISGR